MAFPINQGVSFSSLTRQWDYDVFLSFRGEDTRYSFTGHLYQALCANGFNSFFDNDLQRGEEISGDIVKAIKSSRISMVIFSQNYAFSSWCLEELVEILNCKKNGQLVLPIFYEVDPSEVCKQEGEFKVALAKHENKFKNNIEKVQRWRAALNEVASLSGLHYEDGAYKAKFIQQVIEYISCTILNGKQLFVAEYPVGVNSRAEAIESLLDTKVNDVRMVGIYGLGGIGKTTIAKAVYNKIFVHFEGSCFLEDVRENSETNDGMIQLQEKLLFNILRGKHLKVRTVAHGINLIRERLCYKKVLLILDDVDKTTQVENLLGNFDWIFSGSRVLVTTKDAHFLAMLGQYCMTYKMQELDKDEALELFNQHAFRGNKLAEDYFELANQIIQYTGGLPLTLKIIGSDLYGRTKFEWIDAMHQYGKILKGDICEILKVSYDGLEENEKYIFLDIACFFKGISNDYVVNILDDGHLNPTYGISRLMDKCLITIGHDGILWMHDLVQQMGREIVRKESPILKNRSRLWHYEDSLEVLTNTKVSNKIRGIKLIYPNPITVQLHAKAFERLVNLKFLIVRNVRISKEIKYLPNGLRLFDWHEYPFFLPSNYSPHQLEALNMQQSSIRLEKIFKLGLHFKVLKSIDLRDCLSIRKLPDLCAPNLEEMDIGGCENLIEVHEAIGFLDKLEMWNLGECKKLQILPSGLRLKSLEFINLAGCTSLEKLPDLCTPNLVLLDIRLEKLFKQGSQYKNLKSIDLLLGLAYKRLGYLFAPPRSCKHHQVLALKTEEGSEGQIKLEPQGGAFDDEAVEMTPNSSEQVEIESEEIGNEALQRWLEFIQDEEMEQAISTLKPQAVDMTSNSSEQTKFEFEESRAISTLEPQGEAFDVEELKMPRSSRQIEFQIKDNEMEHEADRPEEARLFLMQGGLGLTEPPKDEDWENAKVMNLMDNELSVLPENPRCPKLSALFLKRNYKLRIIPPSFFDCMPALQILNLSRTGIKSLPNSIIRLVNLKRLFLNDCHCFIMLSPKVGELKQLEVLDLEGTEIMDLPQEIKKLTNLTCLEVSFCEYMSDGKQAMQSNAVVPCGVISELSQLEELNIDVNPEDDRWDTHLENIVKEVCVLNRLETLKFYFPRVELLRQFLCNSPLLSHFRFTVGRHVKRIISRVPPDVEFELGRWERCLIYINGEDVPGDIKKVLQHVTAFFLDRHATVKKLSNFGIRNMMQLKCLVMGECNEVQVIIDEADVYEEDDISKIVSDSYATEKIVLGSLEYLYIYYMKSLRSIWEGSVQQNSLILLRSLTLCTCPQLTVIFSQGLLANLCNLEELKVKGCPSVNSIVSCKIFSEDRTSYFLPNLKRISLHYMTGLDNISSGLQIAPKLEWLSFYDCPNLNNPFIDEISSQDLKKIKGESIWWEALEWSNGCPAYLDKIFVPIDDIWDC